MLRQPFWGFPHSGIFWKWLLFLLRLWVFGGYIPSSSGDTMNCCRCLAQAASVSWADVEVGAQIAKGWHFHGRSRSEKYWLAALNVWGLSRRGWWWCCTACMGDGTWWYWLEKEMCGLWGLWNGGFPLRLSMAQVRFLQCYHRHAVSFLQLAQFK